MKWLVGSLVALNVVLFLLASLVDDSTQNDEQELPLAENLSPINLINATGSPLPGNCSNIGPIKQQTVLNQLKTALGQKSMSYRVLTEAQRKVATYRVIIPIAQSSNATELKERLKVTGVEEPFEKTLENGDVILSLGVFSYKSTATELADNLVNAGFSASAEQEFMQFPQRYWLNLDKSIDQLDSVGLNFYTKQHNLHRASAKCL